MPTIRFEHRYAWIMAIDDEQARSHELARLLEQTGFSYGSRSAVNLLLLSEHLSIVALQKDTLASLHTASPDMALNGFERLAGVVNREQLTAVLHHRRRLHQFMVLCGASPFLTNLIFKEPVFFSRLFSDNELACSRTRIELLAALRRMVPICITRLYLRAASRMS